MEVINMEDIEDMKPNDYYLSSDSEDDEEEEYDYNIMKIISSKSIIEINDREFAKNIYDVIVNTNINININIINALLFFVDVFVEENEFQLIKNIISKKAKNDVVNFM